MYYGGIDSGSLTTDAVLISDREIVAYEIVPTGASNKKAAERAWRGVLEKADVKSDELAYVIATGYGRESIDFTDGTVTEITCHGRGVHYFFNDVRTVIDVGGQDSKVIRIDETGRVIDFAMNDKCAAGTGRFMEVMAGALEVELEKMGDMYGKAKTDVAVSSTCTVFAESEVVGLVASGYETPDIIRAISRAIAGRVAALAGRVGVHPPVAMTGGVAKNKGVVNALEERLRMKLKIPPEPQIVGAVGAALHAAEKLKQKNSAVSG